MSDALTPAQRRRCMSAVRREHTLPETILRSILHKAGLRFRLHDRRLPGSPDLVFSRFRAVIFVHGCYWHSHGCYKTSVPKTRREYWQEKLQANRRRDMRNIKSLLETGWRVMIVWECVLAGKTSLSSVYIGDSIKRWLLSSARDGEIPDSPDSEVPTLERADV